MSVPQLGTAIGRAMLRNDEAIIGAFRLENNALRLGGVEIFDNEAVVLHAELLRYTAMQGSE